MSCRAFKTLQYARLVRQFGAFIVSRIESVGQGGPEAFLAPGLWAF